MAAHHRPESMVENLVRVNHFLLERMEGEKYATVFYAILQPDGTCITRIPASVRRHWCGRVRSSSGWSRMVCHWGYSRKPRTKSRLYR